ncbi:MAG TPA: LLM class flavin-dependent oxidoreductase [Hansschlegelia sp.]
MTDPDPKLSFGAWLPVYGGWLRARGFETEPSFAECRDVAIEAEQGGFEFVYASENFLNCIHGPRHDVLDVWTTLAGLASATERIGLVGALKPSFRPAVAAAQMIATVDKIARGRIEANLVCGWQRDEFAEAGLPWEGHDEKYDHATRYLAALEAYWGGAGERPRRALHGGRRPPIWVSGHSDAALTLAGRCAETLFINGMAPEDVAALRERLRGLSPDRAPRIAMNAFVILAETDQAAEAARADLLTSTRPELIAYYREAIAASGADTWSHLSDAELLDANGGFATALVGSPDTIRRRLATYAQAGVDAVVCQFPSMADDVRRFAREVVAPLARSGRPASGAASIEDLVQ